MIPESDVVAGADSSLTKGDVPRSKLLSYLFSGFRSQAEDL